MKSHSNKWSLVYILPDLNIYTKFGNDYIAIINSQDPLIKQLENYHDVEILLTKFEDQYSKPVKPSLLIINDSKNKNELPKEGVVAFRNILAISSIIKGLEHRFLNNFNAYPLYSEYFDLYPITISKGSVIIDTPSVMGICQDLNNFKGQASPSLDHSVSINPSQYCSMLDKLNEIWIKSFIHTSGMKVETRRLFRSFEMAIYGCSIPFKNNETIHDHGVSASLWVSSFEILAHDGSRSSLKRVVALLGEYKWFSKNTISKKSFKSPFSFKVNLVQKLYIQLNSLRNDFLHGNKISHSKIFPFKNKNNKSIIYYVPLIYKIALLSYLQKFTFQQTNIDEFSNWFDLNDTESKIKEILLSTKDRKKPVK